MLDDISTPAAESAPAPSSTDTPSLADIASETPDSGLDPSVFASENAPEAEAPPVEAQPAEDAAPVEAPPAEAPPAEPINVAELLGTLDAPDKLTALQPAQLLPVAQEVFSRWQEAQKVQHVAQQIEDATGIGFNYLPEVMNVTSPLLFGENEFDAEKGLNGVQAFMERLYEYGADPSDPDASPSAMQKGQLYTSLLGNMLAVELQALDGVQAPDGQLPWLVEHAYKPIFKQLLGVEPTPELISTLKQVAQFGLPAQAEGNAQDAQTFEAIQATLDLVQDKALHNYWRELTPSQQKYLMLSTTPTGDVIEALQSAKERRETREIATRMESETKRTQEVERERRIAAVTERAYGEKVKEIDAVIAQAGKLFNDPEQESWKNEQVREAIMREFRDGGKHAAAWNDYLKWTKEANKIKADSASTKVTRIAREIFRVQNERWLKLKAPKATPATLKPVAPAPQGNGRAQFTPAEQAALQGEYPSLHDIAFGRA
jgi:hypothetical protein